MTVVGSESGLVSRASNSIAAILSLGDGPEDSEDLRLRKRVGVAAGYVTIVAPLSMPFEAGFSVASWSLAIGLSIFAAINLVVLARTRDFNRYVVLLLISGVIFVPAATFHPRPPT